MSQLTIIYSFSQIFKNDIVIKVYLYTFWQKLNTVRNKNLFKFGCVGFYKNTPNVIKRLFTKKKLKNLKILKCNKNFQLWQ